MTLSSQFQTIRAEYRSLAERLTSGDSTLRRWLRSAFSTDAELASDAIRRIELHYPPALAALIWSFFWIEQGELFQARNELERIQHSPDAHSLWGGIDVMFLGHLLIEMGDLKTGNRLLRDGQRILNEPKPPPTTRRLADPV